MSIPVLRTTAPLVVGALLISLLAGCAAVPPVDALAGAATATLTRSTAVHCAADAAMKPRSTTVAYTALPGSTFTRKVPHAEHRVVRLGTTTLQLHDFRRTAGTLNGGVLGSATGGLVGAGVQRTTVELAPHSSTHAQDVPTVFPHPNQLSVLSVSGTARVLRGFTLLATPQGHLYNGLRVSRVHDLTASRLRVLGIRGDGYRPPGETFGINDFRTVGSRWSHILVDGRGVGASGFGVNSSRRVTICAATSRNNGAAMGFAFWQSSGIRLVDCRAVDNGFAGFNFERTTGKVVLIRPVAEGNTYDMRIASDRGSARFRIVDPKLAHGRWTVWLPRRWYGATNTQRRSDVTLIVHGRSRPDLLRFRTY